MKKRMYYCRVLTQDQKLRTLTCIANSYLDAENYLQKNNLFPLLLRPGMVLIARHFKKKELLTLTRQLHYLLSSGIPLLNALMLVIEEQTNPYWYAVLHHVAYQIQHGQLFSSSLNEFPMAFPHFYRAITTAGDTTSELIHCQTNIIAILEKQLYLKKKIIKGLRYPFFLTGTLIVVMVIIIEFLFPQFQSIYDTFDAQLPFFTQCTLSTLQFLQNHLFSLILSILSSSFFLHYFLFRRPIYALQKRLTKMPKIGLLCKYYHLYLLFQYLSLTQKAAIPLMNGLTLAKNHMAFLPYKKVLEDITTLLKNGHHFSDIIKKHPLFFPLCYQYIRIAEETGSFTAIFERLQNYYQQQTEITVENYIALFEPILIFFLCLIICSVMLALYLPIANLGEIIV